MTAKLYAMSLLGASLFPKTFCALITELNALYLQITHAMIISNDKTKTLDHISEMPGLCTSYLSVLKQYEGPNCIISSTRCNKRCTLDLLAYSGIQVVHVLTNFWQVS